MKRVAGFTIVELLIVIVVIGILAAISIVSYGGVQKKVLKSAVASDLSQAGKLMEAKSAKNLNVLPTGLPEDYKSSGDIKVAYVYGNKDEFCLTATSPKDSSIQFYLVRSSTPKEGSCPDGGLTANRCAAGKVYAIFTYRNNSTETVNAAIAHPWGNHAMSSVAPGSADSVAFTNRLSSIEEGYIPITVTITGPSGSVTKTLFYYNQALTC